MNSFDFHPDLDALELNLLNRLELEEKEEVVRHLSECGPCRRMSAALQGQIDLIRRSLQPC